MKANIEERCSSTSRIYISVFSGLILYIIEGTTIAWTSPLLKKLTTTEDNPLGRPLTDDEYDWMASMSNPGYLVGAFTFGFIAERIGRKPLLILISLPFTLFFLIMGFGQDVWLYLFANFVAGFGQGGLEAFIPIYICELANPNIRGRLCACGNVFSYIGQLLTYCIAPTLSFQWYHINLLALPLFFMVIFTIFALESPYYLLRKDPVKAEQILKQLRGRNDITDELIEMKNGLEKTSDTSFLGVFRTRGTRRALVIGFGMTTIVNLAGTLVIMTYTQLIFDIAGGTWSSETEMIVFGIIQMVASILASRITDDFGRKPLLIISYAGIAISHAFLGGSLLLKDNGTSLEGFGWIPLFSLAFYAFSLSLGIGPLGQSILGELFPQRVKNAAVGACTVNLGIWAFMTTIFFPKFEISIGLGKCCLIFAAFSVCGAIFSHLVLIETKGKTLEQVQDELNQKKYDK